MAGGPPLNAPPRKDFIVKRVADASLFFGAALALSLVGCHVTHPGLPASAIVLTPAAVTVTALVTDAATGLPVASTLTIYTQTGTTPLAGPMTSNSGVFTYVPGSVTAPVSYRLVASASGYGTASRNLTITSDEVKADGSGLATATLALNSTSNSTLAPVTAVTGTTSANGTTTAAITSTTPSVAGVAGEASVTIPSSTVLTTASGAPLTGTVTLVASYSNAQRVASLTAYPSGTQAIVNGAATTIMSAGSVTCTVKDANGNVAKNFSPAVKVTIPVPDGTLNPTTGNPVAAGQSISIYYIGDDGLLVPLTDTNGVAVTAILGPEVGSGATGYFPATFPTTHFCSFNAAWTAPSTTSYTVKVTGAAGNPVNGIIYVNGGGWFSTFTIPAGSTDPYTLTVSNVPVLNNGVFLGMSALVSVAGTSQTYTLLNGVDQSLSLGTLVNSVSTATANITVEASDTLLPIPSAVVTVTSLNQFGDLASFDVGATDTTGVARIPGLIQGRTYTVTAYYNSLLPNPSSSLTISPSGNGLTLLYAIPTGYTGLTGSSNP